MTGNNEARFKATDNMFTAFTNMHNLPGINTYHIKILQLYGSPRSEKVFTINVSILL